MHGLPYVIPEDAFFPELEQYRVKSRLDLQAFLAKGHLTDREKQFIKAYTDELALLYRIQYPDRQELLILMAKLKKWDFEHLEQTLAMRIASGMPYQCLILVCNGAVAYPVLPQRKDSTKEYGRSVCDKAYRFPGYVPLSDSIEDVRVRKSIQDAINGASALEEAVQRLLYEKDCLWEEKKDEQYMHTVDPAFYYYEEFEESCRDDTDLQRERDKWLGERFSPGEERFDDKDYINY